MGLGGNKIEKCELKATSARLWITSLNSHFPHLRLSTKYGEYSEVAMFHEISELNKKNP